MTTQQDRLTGLVGPAAIKVPCTVAAVAAITLSGEQTVNGVAVVTGDRVLVTAQASAVDNGIYVVDTGDWNRAPDMDGPYDLVEGTLVYIGDGTTSPNRIWKCTSSGTAADPVDIGTDAINFQPLDIEVSGLQETRWCGTATGTGNALVLTPTTAVSELAAGLLLTFKAGAAGNTGAATIAVSGLAATAVQGNGAALVGGEIVAGKWYSALYDGAAFQLAKISPLGALAVLDTVDTAQIDDGAVTAAKIDPSGSALQKLRMNAAGTAAEWGDAIQLGTPQATTSGTAIDFTGIPAGARRVTINFTGVSTNSSSNILVTIGDSGGFSGSGYASTSASFAPPSAITSDNSTAGFLVTGSNGAAAVIGGRLVLELENAATNAWVATGAVKTGTGTVHLATSDAKTLSGALDRVRITTVSGDTFDAGEINITYER